MPSLPNYVVEFKKVYKTCAICSVKLKLNNSRDIDRKNFCSKSCANKHSALNRKTKRKQCKICAKMFDYTVGTAKFCLACRPTQIERSYKMLDNNPEKYFQHLLYKRGRELLSVNFLLSLLEKQNGLCAISKQKLTFNKELGKRVRTNASIDQKIAGGGYTEENVQLVCNAVNTMKLDMTEEELLFWCRAILEG